MNIQNMVKLFLAFAITLSLSRCGTLFGRTGVPSFYPNAVSSPRQGVYPATQLDAFFIPSPLMLFAIIDLLISLVTDTIMLPVDIYRMN